MSAEPHLITGADGRPRCWWCGDDPEYVRYHDEEWGRPVVDDRLLFEKLCLEGFQAGLSWLTILRKRDNFRAAFRDFEPAVVARFNAASVERLLQDAGIVRHRGKIESTIHNARRHAELVAEAGSLAAHVWSFEPPRDFTGVAAVTPASTALAKDLKRRGFRFVGPTTVHAFLQAMGLVNEHLPGCHVREAAEAQRRDLRVPR